MSVPTLSSIVNNAGGQIQVRTDPCGCRFEKHANGAQYYAMCADHDTNWQNLWNNPARMAEAIARVRREYDGVDERSEGL